ncbi:MAG: hypothetical protein RLY58_1116 [Pseudomonadota bacterium]|jgi:uncharacterized membrane protein YGL010W
MKTLNTWLAEYGESHQNQTNKRIHWLCVPAILFSLVGISWHISTVLTIVLLALMLLFFVRLSKPLFLALGLLLLLMLTLVATLPVGSGFYIGLFVVAWIGQFYGHKIEGKKPSFFKDLQFLLIGPAWCMDALMQKVTPQWSSLANQP